MGRHVNNVKNKDLYSNNDKLENGGIGHPIATDDVKASLKLDGIDFTDPKNR